MDPTASLLAVTLLSASLSAITCWLQDQQGAHAQHTRAPPSLARRIDTQSVHGLSKAIELEWRQRARAAITALCSLFLSGLPLCSPHFSPIPPTDHYQLRLHHHRTPTYAPRGHSRAALSEWRTARFVSSACRVDSLLALSSRVGRLSLRHSQRTRRARIDDDVHPSPSPSASLLCSLSTCMRCASSA